MTKYLYPIYTFNRGTKKQVAEQLLHYGAQADSIPAVLKAIARIRKYHRIVDLQITIGNKSDLIANQILDHQANHGNVSLFSHANEIITLIHLT